MKTPAQISLFLSRMKRIVEEKGFIYVDRDASNQFLADRGYSHRDLILLILSLEVEDCFDGPEPDRDVRYRDKWTVAEFAPVFRGEKLYLKMSIRVDSGTAKCLSVKLYVERVEGR